MKQSQQPITDAAHPNGPREELCPQNRPYGLLAVLCALLLCTAPSIAQSKDDTQTRLDQLQSQIKALRVEVDHTRGERDNARQQLRNIEKRIGTLLREQHQTQQQQSRSQQQLKALKQQQKQSQQHLTHQQAQLKQLIRLRHQQGQQGQLKLLLNQQDINSLGRNSQYLQYFNTAQLETMASIDSELLNLQQLQQRGEIQQQQLDQTARQLEQQQKQLDEERLQRRQLLGSINQQLQSKEARLRKLLEDAKQLEQLLQRIAKEAQKRAQKSTQFAKLRGKLPWPAKGKLSAKFGQSRNLGKLTWEGVVISAPMGNNVRAVADGEVVFSDWLRGYGLLLIVDHGQGYLTLYGHNQSLNKQVGDRVKQSEVIASIGNSGGNSEPGLYFEIRKKGNPVNPKRWCRGSSPG